MVRDNLDITVVQSQKQKCEAVTQSQTQPPEEPQRAQNLERVNPESQETAEGQLDLLHWNKLNLEEEPETWHQVSTQSLLTVCFGRLTRILFINVYPV